jgi:hypothetical protein
VVAITFLSPKNDGPGERRGVEGIEFIIPLVAFCGATADTEGVWAEYLAGCPNT